MRGTLRRSALSLVLMVGVLSGPVFAEEKTITDLSTLVGTWQGDYRGATGGSCHATIIVKADGSYVAFGRKARGPRGV